MLTKSILEMLIAKENYKFVSTNKRFDHIYVAYFEYLYHTAWSDMMCTIHEVYGDMELVDHIIESAIDNISEVCSVAGINKYAPISTVTQAILDF